MSNTQSIVVQFTPDFFVDPYMFYRAFYDKGVIVPVQMFEGVEGMMVTGLQEVEAILKDSRFVREIEQYLPEKKDDWMGRGTGVPEQWLPLVEMQRKWMLMRDGAEHTRLRNPVQRAFTPAVIDRLRPHIEEISNSLIDSMKGKETVDLIADYAFPLPCIVIAELLGVPSVDREKFKDWSTALIVTLDPTVTPEQMTLAAQVSVELMTYFRGLLNERRAEPKDDLISDMVRSGQMTDDELLAACVLMLVAGHETTVNLIGNGMLTLLRNPDQLQKLVEDPSLYPNAVEEMLRFEPPVQFTQRFASQDLEFAGRQFKAGQVCYLMLAGANRDPRVFEEPNTFDVTRKNAGRHISFAAGAHFCIGANLARAEAQIALRVLCERMKEIELLADNVQWRPSTGFRGLAELPLRCKID